MFRIYLHALRFTRLQSQVHRLQKTDHTPTDKPVLPNPTHMLSGTQPLVFKPPHSETLLGRPPEPICPPVAHTRDKRV